MTAEQILQCIEAPEKLNEETLPFLKELTAQHPAFEAAWILYLRNLKNLNDSSFGQELINGAIRIHDRRRLYLFLNTKNNEKDPEQTASSEAELDIFNHIFAPEYRLEAPAEAEKLEDENTWSIQNESEKKFKLIDKFLEAQPRMPQIKNEESSSPIERQHENQEENDDLVTETLAMIYAKQGYNRKAIQIFEKLSLKYPEKSTYFAAQIEKINQLMNN